jgi:competence protein ComEA
MPSPTRRSREPDPVVAARLQAIRYADPYVFVHADDVLDTEPLTYQAISAPADVGGWVPEPPTRRPDPPPPATGPPAILTTPKHAPRSALRARWDDTRQRLELAGGGLVALLVLGLLAAAVAVVMLLRAQPHATPLATGVGPTSVHSSGVTVAHPTGATSTPVTVTVDVSGKVHHPGVFKLSSSSRVIDAVRAAGGPLHGVSLDSLNLAARLTDGQQVVVGGAVVAAGPPDAAGTTQTAVVDVNSATVEQLQTLPGIGPVLAQHIVDYRTQHGPFATVDALRQVSGIGPSKFAQLKDHVSA